MNNRLWIKRLDNERFIFYDSEPNEDDELYVGEYKIANQQDLSLHPFLLNMDTEDPAVEVMVAPLDSINLNIQDEYFIKIAKALRPLWPKGEKDDKYPWRDSIENLTKRLKTLWDIRKLREYTVEECVIVANKYLNRFTDNAKFMQTLKYFILKQDRVIDHDGRIHYTNKSMFADMLDSNDAESDFIDAFEQSNQGVLI